MGSRGLIRSAWALCALTLAFIACATVLGILNHMEIGDYFFTIVLISYALVGGLVASRHPANPIGWLCIGGALFAALRMLTAVYAVYGITTNPGALPSAETLAGLSNAIQAIGPVLLFILIPLYFPNGRPVSRRWGIVAWLALGLLLPVISVMQAVSSGEAVDGSGIANPWSVKAFRPVSEVLVPVWSALYIGLIFASAASLVVRFRRSPYEERQQIKWLTFAAAFVPVWFLTNGPIDRAFPALFAMMDSLVLAGVPVAVGIAILKYRLYDIDLIINRTFVYGVLTACVVALYVLVVGYLGALLHSSGDLIASLIATGSVAIIFAPLRYRLQTVVNRLMYGARDEPYKVLTGLGERLESTLTPNTVLPTVVETVASALKLPYAAITLKQDGKFVEAAHHGKKPAGEFFTVPLAYQKETVGKLILAPRTPGESFTKSDVRLLEDLARQIEVAAYAVRLTADLRRSRERLVTAREEERRRLRRDLHDDVGPQLAALGLKLETASKLLSHDQFAAALMADLSERARAATSGVRRSVHALRPPALDELGLVPALREGAAQFGRGGLHISLEAPASLPPLSAAVEVAAFRIAQEAIINAVRHARARNCSVLITLDEKASTLGVQIEDDGRGIEEDYQPGVGISSMRERAEELGGKCTVGSRAGGGTLVSARLPCRAHDEDDNPEE